MPPAGKSPRDRAREALELLAQQGGESSLPATLKSADVLPLMGRGWFSDALRLDLMPGMRIQRGGVWRCDRATFVGWLAQLADLE